MRNKKGTGRQEHCVKVWKVGETLRKKGVRLPRLGEDEGKKSTEISE